MSAVWRTARAAVRRRKIQTFVIGLVVLLCTLTIVVALALVAASSGPFDRAFGEQRGPHLAATFDARLAGEADLTATVELDEVTTAAGPFGQVTTTLGTSSLADGPGFPVAIVGRDEPAGPVDRLDLWEGRWATATGEIVIDAQPGDLGLTRHFPIGSTVRLPDGPALTVVGYAYSFSRTAGAWVAPEQMDAMGPTETQMLYRFADHDGTADIDAAAAAVGAAVPTDALVSSRSYLTLRDAIASNLGVYLVLLTVFGILGLVVAVLIVANVVSGAVVSRFRHIGILKSLGFTPRQVVAVYLLMVSVPAVIGAVVGTVLANLVAPVMMTEAFQQAGLGTPGVSLWVDAVALLGMPTLVLLAALAPALRAHRLSAAEAISTGSAPHSGRGLRAQRRLSGTRLPRSVSLGLGLPFARPGRTAMTAGAVVLGVTTAAFAVGLAASVTELEAVTSRSDAFQVMVQPAGPPGQSETPLSDDEVQETLSSLPGTANVTANGTVPVSAVGFADPPDVWFIRGDSTTMGFTEQLLEGRWSAGDGEAVATSKFMNEQHMAVGDRITLGLEGQQETVTVVGVIAGSGRGIVYTGWDTLTALAPDVEELDPLIRYEVRLQPGTDVEEYLDAVSAAGLYGQSTGDQTGSVMVTIIGIATSMTLLLGAVSALGVFNTVLLNARERRRDLGMLKSIGMTPRQVVSMMVTSMAVLGAVGGLIGIALGAAAHRLVLPLAAASAQVDIPDSVLQIWNAPILTALALAGLVIAVAGAYVPARRAARLTIAEVLHSE